MGLKDYLESAQRGDDSELKEFAKRVMRGDSIDDDLTTAHDRWLFVNVVAPAVSMSNREVAMAALIAKTAAEMPPIVKGAGAMAEVAAIMQATRRKEP